MGRPLKPIAPEVLENLASIGCTVAEMAAVLDCSKRTLETRFRAVVERGRERGKTSLGRQQWKKAMEGNVVMMIWLGKQMLAQKDRIETDTSLKIEGLSTEELAKETARMGELVGSLEALRQAPEGPK